MLVMQELLTHSKCEYVDVLFGQMLVWKKYARLSEICAGKALTNVKIASLFTQWEENEEDGNWK